ncbi:hypothetical protein [Deinococcus aquaedulcis]|uniref:hypothetical protein n=1 Tax=Deinococcus aquaedulcis TaxID=2840455 RepID=UPI001C8321E0|nr:hypothetical protein [Deinococcus aquaedulcis]
MSHRQDGVTTIVIVLFTGVLLLAMLVGSMQMTLGNRVSTANEAQAFNVALVSESGQNAFVARSLSIAPFNAAPTCLTSCEAYYTNALRTWLSKSTSGSEKVGTFAVGNNGNVQLSVAGIRIEPVAGTSPQEYRLASVDIRSTGTLNGNTARIVQTYSALKTSLPFPNVPGAVTSRPSVALQGGVEIVGGALGGRNDGVYQRLLKVTRDNQTNGALSATDNITVDVTGGSQARSRQLPEGSYVRLPVGTGTGTFQVTTNYGTSLDLRPVNFSGLTGTLLPPLDSGQLDLDFVTNGVESYTSNSMVVRALETFIPGDTLSVTVGTTTYTATVNSAVKTGNSQNLSISWNGTAPPLAGSTGGIREGSAVTKTTNAVVTAGTFSNSNNASVTGRTLQGRGDLIPSALNDALFLKTFNMTPSDMKAMSKVEFDQSFDGTAEGMHWIMGQGGTSGESINLNSEKLTGKGIIIVDGDLTINQNGAPQCGLSGILYVRGNVRIQGGLELCGALVVEGSILDSSGAVIGLDNDASFFAGNGRKVTYSMDALMDAVGSSGPYDFTSQVGYWRQR